MRSSPRIRMGKCLKILAGYRRPSKCPPPRRSEPSNLLQPSIAQTHTHTHLQHTHTHARNHKRNTTQKRTLFCLKSFYFYLFIHLLFLGFICLFVWFGFCVCVFFFFFFFCFLQEDFCLFCMEVYFFLWRPKVSILPVLSPCHLYVSHHESDFL